MEERPDPLAPPPGYGDKIAEVSGGHARVDTLCAVDRATPSSPPSCEREFEFTWIFGDVAEHIQRVELCATHSDELFTGMCGGLAARCTRCRNRCRLERVTERATGRDSWHKAALDEFLNRRAQAALDALRSGI